jgi:hypothetical protein
MLVPMKTKHVKIGRLQVRIPLAQLLAAIPGGVRAAIKKGADDRDPSSPGGKKITAAEIAEDVAAFFKAWGEAALPAILQANGLP